MPRRVLLIDDNLAVQKLVELTLRKEGFEVTPVDNALSALDFALKNPPELILADYNLEGMNVFTFVEKLRLKQRLSETPIILLINSTESYNPAQLQSAGIQAFLKKPIDSKELTRQVLNQTGSSETMMMDLNALPQKGETSLSEHFSNPGSDAVKIEELLGWSSPGTLTGETTQQIRMDQTIAAPIPPAEEAPPVLELDENVPDLPDLMEETQYFQVPPAIQSPATEEAPPSMESPPQTELQTPLETPLEEAPAQHGIFEEKPEEQPSLASPPPTFDEPEPAQATPSGGLPPIDPAEIEKEIRKNVSETVEKVAWEILPSLIESAVTKEAITAIVEKIVWEVVPSLAEIEIKKEIKRLQAEGNEPPQP